MDAVMLQRRRPLKVRDRNSSTRSQEGWAEAAAAALTKTMRPPVPQMDLSGRAGGLGIELLNQSNYKLNAKAEFVLKRSISPSLFDHIVRCKSAHEIWQTFDKLFNKKDEAQPWASYLTGGDGKLSNLQQYSGRKAIVTADNTVHQVKNQGTVIINGKHQDLIMLDNVYHVPGMRKNLFSVANAIDAGHFVLFRPHDVKFRRNIKELKVDVVHIGKRANDLFVLSASNLYVEKMSSNDNLAIWHARLGHVDMEKLKAMVKLKLVDGMPQLNNFSEGHIYEGVSMGRNISFLSKDQYQGVRVLLNSFRVT
ncbi:uncharacterized protein LOC122036231 [Zingiber officinale]|uniref:uncharacterized protein LOC122036231 n=1 Tax=Zingiber officinale TaxID=94328 RepID=UPI001C4AB544|nr:uncharacterized protein LOC122036231 [Zingiber officinale]